MPDGIDPLLKWAVGILVAANSVQYARDWARERRYQRAMAEKDAAIAAAQSAHRADLVTMLPALTRVLDWVKS